MSTTHVQSLPNVRGRMSYTEFGEGKRRREHLENGTDRIAAQMGDAASREDFIVYCEGQKHRHPNAVNEGYEVRISWATDELDPDRPDDIQRGMEYAYTLCHELAPDSMCWVTMHVDGEGGCVHAHATIANHDARSGQVINKEDTSLYAPRVQAVNDRLSRENGFQVLGADREMSAWEQRRDTFGYDSFDRRLGDKVAYARDRSDTVDEFKRNLELEGVTLKETVKTDKKTGEVTAGWSYKAVDEWGPKRRSRKRRASNLADDLTKEGVEAYFEEKQRQAEAQRKTCRHLFPQRSSRPNRSRILRQSLHSTCTPWRSPTWRRWRATFRGHTSTAAARAASRSWASATGSSWRRSATQRNSWRSCKPRWTLRGASSTIPRRRATRSTIRARTCWLARGCSPRPGAMPRTPCPA